MAGKELKKSGAFLVWEVPILLISFLAPVGIEEDAWKAVVGCLMGGGPKRSRLITVERRHLGPMYRAQTVNV